MPCVTGAGHFESGPAAPIADEVLARLDLITPNRSETELLTGLKVENVGDAVAAAAWFRGRGVRRVAVTMGSAGALVADERGEEFVPAYRVEAVDTTAAGDVFNGAGRRPLRRARVGELQHVSPPPRLQSPVPASAPSVPFRSGAK